MSNKCRRTKGLFNNSNSEEFITNLVKEIAATYDDEKGINHIDGNNLPNEYEVINIINHVMELIFPGYSEKKIYSKSLLVYNAGEITANLYVELYHQITRAMLYDLNEDCSQCELEEQALQSCQKVLSKLPKIREMMKADVIAAFDGDPAAKSLDEIILSYPGIKAIAIQRFAHELYHENIPFIPRMFTEYAHRLTGIDIHPGAHLGSGIFIDHGTGVVIGETARLGDNVKIYQGVTLGALSFPKDSCGKIIKGAKRHPTIENNVTIYSGATVLGNIVIGSGAIIGGNVWITDSVEPKAKITISSPELTIKTANKL
ncbi:serine O-acetyltransferase EpsC [Lentisphaerota bacterium WC36G]|nr:serine acetyltransferase [Lentisphaerae bacterium WC36]